MTPAGLSRLREAGIGSVLMLSSMAVFLLGAELLVRTVAGDPKRWVLENFVTYPASAEGRWTAMQPDALLGYKPRPGYSGNDQIGGELLSFDARGLRVHRRSTPPSSVEAPVLVVGDSYAMGEEVHDEETFPAHLQDLLDRPVLNGGVAGYGIDQMVLHAEQLVPALRPGHLVVSFIGDDVRRTQERILWGVAKPYFDIVDGALQLRNVPVPPAVERPLDTFRRIAGYSFLVDNVMERLDLAGYWLAGQARHREGAHAEGDRISCLLMGRLGELGRAHNMKILVVAQYTPLAWMSESTRTFETETTGALLACARQNGLDTLDTAAAAEAAVRRHGLETYYVGGHMNNNGNRLTAQLISDQLVKETNVSGN